MSQKTHKKNASSYSGNNLDFSVVQVGRSPSYTGNLTGTPRKVKDSCADIYNLIQKWNCLNCTGTEILKKIANSKIQFIEGERYIDTHNTYVTSSEGAGDFPVGLEDLCDLLLQTHQQMKETVSKLEKITRQLENLCRLTEMQKSTHKNVSEEVNKDPEIIDAPLFLTWSMRSFYQNAQDLLRQYQKELKVKRCVVEEVAHLHERDALMFFVSSWTYQPYIEDSSQLIVESMVVETGLR
ncbi:cyclin-dependent kinase 2-interacting protein-like [Limulus polyphemus]|uniref:Cyclin-dependent kinase 2-interacting protein-like n=1 Tax=Limulus polyphemus TaxID=6850 RepID=A0ABM1BBS8_LIMPO|nr:cyclin-dependent kinase 2-interacting protein-like [Limulus polyphemus]XP_013778819.1 cyclin-dependent kinase 2-interacting protein-like [Limulus polyphemus]XP_022246520.1 cyclin-dependent kinase 2-interacting protein-like [Limulus polyphemus]XP_022246521.1 cyclin-dependent kinase 2-interacting protein-like [Limulus polyphemus]